jgi:tetratricopeptide (TPR) repeat protein
MEWVDTVNVGDRRFVFGMKKTIATLIVVAALAVGQAPAQKNWKDRAEYDLYAEIVKPDATPAARLTNLDKWKAGYAQSEYAPERTKIYLMTYQQLNRHREAFDTATEILKTEPNDQTSVQEILGFVRALMPTQANAPLSAQNKADLDLAEKVARGLLANPDAVYGADKKPQGVADDAWGKIKPTMMNFAQFTLGYIAVTQKDLAKSEAELVKTLQADPTNAQASYMLAGILLGQQKDHPEKMPFAMFEYARAAVYDGPGALDAKTRPQIDAFLGKAYNTYHGSAQGLNDIKTQAKTNALPPGGFAIKSVVDIAKEDEAKRKEKEAANPMLAFWEDIKENLTGDGGAAYWDAMKDAGLPPKEKVPEGKFKGKLVSATPETRPKELTLAIGGDAANVTLKLDEPLPGKMDPGGEISFFGAAKEFAKDPYMITFEVAPTDIEGWTGKGPAPARPAGAGKKGAPAPATKK